MIDEKLCNFAFDEDWERIRTVVETGVLDVNAYHGLLIRLAVDHADAETVRLLTGKWKADLRVLEPWSFPPRGQAMEEIVEILLSAADSGRNRLDREEMLYRLMRIAVYHDASDLKNYLIERYGADGESHPIGPERLAYLVETKEWDRIRSFLDGSTLGVDAYDGLLLRKSFENADEARIRLWLEEYKADLRLLKHGAFPEKDEMARRAIDLLIFIAGKGENGLNPKELVHHLMMMAIREKIPHKITGRSREEIVGFLIQNHNADVNAYGGVYGRLLVSVGDFDLFKKLLSWGFSEKSLRSLAWMLYGSGENILLLAQHLRYQDQAQEIEFHAEQQEFYRQACYAQDVSMRDLGYPNGRQLRQFAEGQEKDRLNHQVYQFWRVWDHLNLPKDRLMESWSQLQEMPKVAMTDAELETLITDLIPNGPRRKF